MIAASWENVAQLRKFCSNAPDQANTALSRAVNRAVANVKSNISKQVRKKYLVKASDVKESLKITSATKSNPVAYVRSTGKRIDLSKFSLSPHALFKGEHDYYIQVRKDGGSKEIPGFAAEAPSWGLYRRTGKERYPISRLMGPAVPEMIGRPGIMRYIEEEGNKTLNKRLAHEVSRMLEAKRT